MRQRYIILSNDSDKDTWKHGTFDTFGTSRPKMPVTVEDLSEGDFEERVRAPDVLGGAPADVPLTLIVPMESIPTIAPATANVWGLDAVCALSSPRTGQGISVAVLDTGLAQEHEAFASLRRQNRIVGRNFTNGPSDDFSDSHGHGTHCAGTIAGGTVGGTRIGIAPGLERLIIGKVLGPGGGTNETLIAAIEWAVSQNAQIVSMSLGIDFVGLTDYWESSGLPRPAAVSRALKQYRDTVRLFGKFADFLATRNVLLVAATGNESSRPNFTIDVAPPAASEHFVKVGAVGQPVQGIYPVAEFSNTGPDLVAPGVGIVSADARGGLVSMSGTSMATPHVAGVAALWAEELRAQNGQASYQDIKVELLGSAMEINGSRIDFGRGMVRAPQ